jgi:hypothetical protein
MMIRAAVLGVAVGCASAPPPVAVAPVVDPASGYTLDGTGDLHDFDTFAGAWVFKNKRLKQRGVHSNDFDEFPAVSCTRLYLDAVSNVDEILFTTRGWAGLTVRTFDKAKKQWSIYWVNGATGVMYPPVFGGFHGDTGDFYGRDTDDGKPVLARFHWKKVSADHLVWEQSFSYDGKTWEMNWTNDLVRGDEAKLCDSGRPRR